MFALRRLIARHAPLAGFVFAAALTLRLLVPAGFMPVIDHGRLVVALCDGAAAKPAMHGMAHHQEPAAPQAGKCAFADLALAMTGGADPIQLAAAIAFVLVLALSRALALPPRAAPRLRPPLRGPPLPA